MMMMEYHFTIRAVLLDVVRSRHLIGQILAVSRAQRLAAMAFFSGLFFYASPRLKQKERDKVERNAETDRQYPVTCLRSCT